MAHFQRFSPLRLRLFVVARLFLGMAGLLIVGLAIGPRASVHADDAPISTLSGWNAQFWSNPNQSGSPTLERRDPSVDFNWHLNAPASGLPSDGFSARWTRSASVLTGRFRLVAVVNGGIRVRVNNEVVIDHFSNQGYKTITHYIDLNSGTHQIEIDYADHGGQARVKFDMQRMMGLAESLPARQIRPNAGKTRFWQGEYFNNLNMTGEPAYIERHTNINFNWGEKSPALNIKRDGFSARFSKRDYFASGIYQFVVQADDNVRVYVDNKLIVNEWLTQHNRVAQSASISLHQGWHDIRIEYADLSNTAHLQVRWELK
ncbi:MAG: PA14 domain-containing protein [Anaerolineae bacterium]|nr:PA14 domain-containing protein [Anaerolineae bacterium]